MKFRKCSMQALETRDGGHCILPGLESYRDLFPPWEFTSISVAHQNSV